MINDLIISMLWSISPFGEAKVGIPYGMLNGVNRYAVFILPGQCLASFDDVKKFKSGIL